MILKTTGLSTLPQRIVSLVPSQTELLHYLGLEAETIGITRFCVHPQEWFCTKTRVGGTKAIKQGIIHQLKPDLIIANKEENLKEQVEMLAGDYPVWVTDVSNLDDSLKMIADIGELTGKKEKAITLVEEIKKMFNTIILPIAPLRVAYLIWQKPYMTVGGDTFINDMLLKCGFINVFSDRKRYPEINLTDLKTAGCQLLLLSSEPYPFRQKHVDELSAQLPACKIVLVNGEFFSWYGSRLLMAPAYFKKLLKSIV